MTRKLEELLGLPSMNEKLKEMELEAEHVEVDDDGDIDIDTGYGDVDDDTLMARHNAPVSQVAPPMPPVPAEPAPMAAYDITPMQMAQHEHEMEQLAQKAITTFEEMKSMAFSVEPKDAGVIFEPMVQMLKLGMDAKSSKIDRKMKLLRLKLDQDRLEHQKAQQKPTEGFVEAEQQSGMLLDRNDILAHISGPKPNTDK